mgnify:CR=1 FL=1
MSNYGSYASYFIDTSTPFDQQMCMFDDTRTWQQYFLEQALSSDSPVVFLLYGSVCSVAGQTRRVAAAEKEIGRASGREGV